MPSPPPVFPQPLRPDLKPGHSAQVSVGALQQPGPSASTRLTENLCGQACRQFSEPVVFEQAH